MPETHRRQTGFRCDDDLLTDFQLHLTRKKLDMSPVIEGWIREFMEGKRPIPREEPGATLVAVPSDLVRHVREFIRLLLSKTNADKRIAEFILGHLHDPAQVEQRDGQGL